MHARLFKFDANRSALIGLDVDVQSPCEICLIFDEMLIDGDVIPRRSNCLNAIKYTLPAGEYRLLSFEPYTVRYLKVCVLKGSAALRRVYMREIAGVEIARVEFRDARIQEIFDAAVNTYRQNASDIFMDCPSRERAGWLCDSFFTGRSEYALTGDNRVETNFLENYAYHTNYFLPQDCSKGLVPMLYPGSTDFMPDRAWIFNWNLWLIIEIGEYALLRRGSQALTGALKDTVYAILDAAFGWENEEGLLEDIPAGFLWSGRGRTIPNAPAASISRRTCSSAARWTPPGGCMAISASSIRRKRCATRYASMALMGAFLWTTRFGWMGGSRRRSIPRRCASITRFALKSRMQSATQRCTMYCSTTLARSARRTTSIPTSRLPTRSSATICACWC